MKSRSGNEAFWKDLHILETLKGGGIYLVVKIAGSIGAYFFAWYVSKAYGAAGNGVFAFVLTAAVLLASFFNLGLNTYTVKLLPAYKAQNNPGGIRAFYHRALTTVAGVTFAGSGILILLSFLMSNESFSRDLYLIGCATIPVSILLFISHVYKARQRIFGFSMLQNNVIQVLALLILVIPVWDRSSTNEPVWAFIVAGVGLCIAGWGMIPSIHGEQTPISKTEFRLHIRESLPMLAGGMAFIVLNLTDRFMLRFLDSTTQLGIYDVALRLSNLTLLGIMSLNAVAEPKFAQLHAENDPTKLRSFAGRITWMGIVVSIPVIGLLGFFPDFWLGLFGTGEDFLVGGSTLRILLLGQALSVSCGAVLVLLNMTGHQRSVQTILFTCATLNIILNFLLIPWWGIDGTAWATAFSTLVWNVWGLWIIRKKLGFWMWG